MTRRLVSTMHTGLVNAGYTHVKTVRSKVHPGVYVSQYSHKGEFGGEHANKMSNGLKNQGFKAENITHHKGSDSLHADYSKNYDEEKVSVRHSTAGGHTLTHWNRRPKVINESSAHAYELAQSSHDIHISQHVKEETTLDIVKRVINEQNNRSIGGNTAVKKLTKIEAILEGRGRPRKDGTAAAEEDSSDGHILMQLRKTITLRGQKPVKFHNGETYGIHPKHAYHALDKYSKIKNADDKEKFVHKLGHSRGSFFTAMQEEYD